MVDATGYKLNYQNLIISDAERERNALERAQRIVEKSRHYWITLMP